MKILIIGGTGTIGKAVKQELAKRHEIITVGRDHGDIHADITDPASIEKMYQSVGKLDAVISTTGQVQFLEFSKMSRDDYYIGINNKLMGQVNLVLIGQHYINPHGSFTLTSGILSDDPIRYGSSASMVNSAINGFVKGAAIEMPHHIRINAISPTIVEESLWTLGEYFYGFEAVPVTKVALAFSKSVEGLQTGKIYKVGY